MEDERARILEFPGKSKSSQKLDGGEQMNGKILDEAITKLFQTIDRSKLNDWERGFIENIEAVWKKTRKLSDKQRGRLAEIGEKQNAPKRPEGSGFKPGA
jgi:hypothetical protein